MSKYLYKNLIKEEIGRFFRRCLKGILIQSFMLIIIFILEYLIKEKVFTNSFLAFLIFFIFVDILGIILQLLCLFLFKDFFGWNSLMYIITFGEVARVNNWKRNVGFNILFFLFFFILYFFIGYKLKLFN